MTKVASEQGAGKRSIDGLRPLPWPSDVELLEDLEVVHAHFHMLGRFLPDDARIPAIARILRGTLVAATVGGKLALDALEREAKKIVRAGGRTDLDRHEEALALRGLVADWFGRRRHLPADHPDARTPLPRLFFGALLSLPLLCAELTRDGVDMSPNFETRPARIATIEKAFGKLRERDERKGLEPDPKEHVLKAMHVLGLKKYSTLFKAEAMAQSRARKKKAQARKRKK